MYRLGNADGERRLARPLPRDARLRVGALGDVDELRQLIDLLGLDCGRCVRRVPGRGRGLAAPPATAA